MTLSEPVDGAMPESIFFLTLPLAGKILPSPSLTSVSRVFCHLQPRKSSLIQNHNGELQGLSDPMKLEPFLHFVVGETKAQRGHDTFTRSHSAWCQSQDWA